MAASAMVDHEQQWRKSLAKAQETRNERYALRIRLKHGNVTMREVFENPYVQSALVFDVLKWQPRWKDKRASHALYGAGIGMRTTVGWMTDRQREALLAIIESC